MPTGVYRCPEEREMRGKGNGFPHSRSAPSLLWEEGKFTTFPHMRLTSISRGVRQEAREGQRRWLCGVLQQFLRKPVNCPLLRLGSFSPELSYTWCEDRFFFSYPYSSCDFPNASKAGTVFIEMQDHWVSLEFIHNLGHLETNELQFSIMLRVCLSVCPRLLRCAVCRSGKKTSLKHAFWARE